MTEEVFDQHEMEAGHTNAALIAIQKEIERLSPREVAELVLKNRERIKHLEELVEVDEKTGLNNERGWNNKSRAEFGQAMRQRRPAASFGMDLDKLKWINDHPELGHDLGDKYLKLFGTAMQMSFRREDVLAHIHGDEYAALVVGVGNEKARGAKTRLIKNMDDLINLTMPDDPFFPVVQTAAKDNVKLGVSVGYAVKEWAPDEQIPKTRTEYQEDVDYQLARLNKAADRDMYREKRERKVSRE